MGLRKKSNKISQKGLVQDVFLLFIVLLPSSAAGVMNLWPLKFLEAKYILHRNHWLNLQLHEEPHITLKAKLFLVNATKGQFHWRFTRSFFIQILAPKITKPNVTREKLLNLLSYEKWVRKMLMKLTLW